MEALIAIVLLVVEAVVLYFLISSAVREGNKDLERAVRANTDRIIKELREMRNENEKE